MNRIKIKRVSETEYVFSDEDSCTNEMCVNIEQMHLLVTDIEGIN